MTAGRRKIVVIDDSVVQLEVISAAFETIGYEVHAVSSVFDVMPTLDSVQPDVVILDVQMPALVGDRVLELIRRNAERNCPVVLFSSLPREQLQKRAEAAGADAYVQKSNNLHELIATVQAHVRVSANW